MASRSRRSAAAFSRQASSRSASTSSVPAGATVVGWLIGAALDRWLHTNWLYLAGLIVGIIAGFVELIRLVTSKESEE